MSEWGPRVTLWTTYTCHLHGYISDFAKTENRDTHYMHSRSSFSPNWLLILMCGAKALNRSSSAQGRTNHSSKLILAGSNSQDAHRCPFGCPRRPMLRVLQSFQLPDSCFRRPQAKLKAFCHPISRLRTGPCGGYGNVSGRGCQGRWPKALRAAVSRYHSCISITCPPKLRSSSEYVWDGCL